MLCTNCGKRIRKTLIKCPFCGERVINKVNYSMPQLREDEISKGNNEDYNIASENNDVITSSRFDELEKSMLETTIDEDLLLGETKQLCFEDMGTLMDDINLQIENMANEGEEVPKEEKQPRKKKKKLESEEKDPLQNVPLNKEEIIEENIETTEEKEEAEEVEEEKVQVLDLDVFVSKDEDEEIKDTIANDEIEINNRNNTFENKIDNEIIKEDIPYKEIKDEDRIETDASVRMRKKIFIITVMSILFLMLGSYGIYKFYMNNDKNNSKEYIEEKNNLKDEVNSRMSEYYISGKLEVLTEYLNEVNKNGQLEEALAIIKEICNEWVTSYYEQEMGSRKELEEASTKLKELISNLYTYGIVETDKGNIKILEKEFYEDCLKQIKEVYNDSSKYFEALELYNDKDYNKSYTTLDSMDTSNRYYSKALNLKKKIEENIIELLNNDIIKLESNIDSLSDSAKLTRYIQIQEIIFEYKAVYYMVDLEHNDNYKELLNKYSDKITEYGG